MYSLSSWNENQVPSGITKVLRCAWQSITALKLVSQFDVQHHHVEQDEVGWMLVPGNHHGTSVAIATERYVFARLVWSHSVLLVLIFNHIVTTLILYGSPTCPNPGRHEQSNRSKIAFPHAPLKLSLMIMLPPSLSMPFSTGSPKVTHTFHFKAKNDRFNKNLRNPSL